MGERGEREGERGERGERREEIGEGLTQKHRVGTRRG